MTVATIKGGTIERCDKQLAALHLAYIHAWGDERRQLMERIDYWLDERLECQEREREA